jgi:predicted Zn-dependent peptidase
MTDPVVHEILPCGVECAVLPLPRRHVASLHLRVLAGCCNEPADLLGVARMVEETLDKGTQSFTGPQLSDAFDAIGAAHNSGTGRETTTFTCTMLPEHLDRAIELHAEFLRRPTFPDDAVEVSVALGQQELTALEDEPHGLLDKYLSKQAHGPLLGRHPLGEPETIAKVSRRSVEDYWRAYYHAGRMLVAVAGPVEPRRVLDAISRHFDQFGSAASEGRSPYPVEFSAKTVHWQKELEQNHIGICWPGVAATQEQYPVQQVIVGILAGGMSGRLFTEVREKRGLVYWVSAWHETPRGSGMMFLGASTTPERSDQTYDTLLREVDRLGEDLTQEELDRAVTGILANWETRGDTTRSRCAELVGDLYFFARPVPVEEKIAKVQAVSIPKIKQYLREHPRDRLCTVTLGPRPLVTDVRKVPKAPIGVRG